MSEMGLPRAWNSRCNAINSSTATRASTRRAVAGTDSVNCTGVAPRPTGTPNHRHKLDSSTAHNAFTASS
jgi:hypothetical protein